MTTPQCRACQDYGRERSLQTDLSRPDRRPQHLTAAARRCTTPGSSPRQTSRHTHFPRLGRAGARRRRPAFGRQRDARDAGIHQGASSIRALRFQRQHSRHRPACSNASLCSVECRRRSAIRLAELPSGAILCCPGGRDEGGVRPVRPQQGLLLRAMSEAAGSCCGIGAWPRTVRARGV